MLQDVSHLDETIPHLFSKNKETHFEDGVATDFSRSLWGYIKTYGESAIDSITKLINAGKINNDIASVALQWIGLLEDNATYSRRLQLFCDFLGSPSRRIRDAAALGLSFLDDPSAIPNLEQAIRVETISELKQDMFQVLEQLRETQQEQAS